MAVQKLRRLINDEDKPKSISECQETVREGKQRNSLFWINRQLPDAPFSRSHEEHLTDLLKIDYTKRGETEPLCFGFCDFSVPKVRCIAIFIPEAVVLTVLPSNEKESQSKANTLTTATCYSEDESYIANNVAWHQNGHSFYPVWISPTLCLFSNFSKFSEHTQFDGILHDR